MQQELPRILHGLDRVPGLSLTAAAGSVQGMRQPSPWPCPWLLLLVSLLIFASAGIASELPTTRLPYQAYGTEERTALRLFNATTRFDEARYFDDFYKCFQDKRRNYGTFRCFGEMNALFKELAVVWSPDKSVLGRLRLDCEYQIEPVHFKHFAEQRILAYKFLITSSDCAAGGAPVPPGGTTFDIFGLNNLFLTHCAYSDSLDGRYHVNCLFPYAHLPSPNIFSPVPRDALCLSLTVVVILEHFDAFSEALDAQTIFSFPDKTRTFFNYSRAVIVDNVSYCFPTPAVAGVLLAAPENTSPLPEPLPPGLTVYSAAWQSDSLFAAGAAAGDYFSRFGAGVWHTALEHRQWQHSTNTFPLRAKTISKQWPRTVPSTALEQPQQPRPHYLYQVVRERGTSVEAVSLNVTDLYTAHVAAAAASASAPTTVHFIGASHARYFFDSVDELTYGPSRDGSDAENRKHASMTEHQYRFHYVQLTDDLADTLTRVCETVAKSTASSSASASAAGKHQVVMLAGVWDLSVAAVRRLLREEHSLPKLERVVEAILGAPSSSSSSSSSSSLSAGCGGLVDRLVWVLMPPHPLCTDDWAQCEVERAYRHNPTIAAVNQHTLDFAARTMRRLQSRAAANQSSPSSLPLSPPPPPPPHVALSVLDLYSIVHPRLQFDEDAEVTCLTHYICRVKWPQMGATVFSLGGKAALDALLDSLL